MRLDDLEIQRVAHRMLADYDARRPNEIFAERGTGWLTLEDAYAVQRAVAKLRESRGERCVGYKVGCASPAVRNQLKLQQPVRGNLWDREAHPSGWRLPVKSFAGLAIEGEVALQLRRDIPAKGFTAEDFTDCVESWFPVIELHNHVFRGERRTSQELVAGNAMHAGFVTPARFDERGLDGLEHAEIKIEVDGRLVEASNVASLPGGPLGSLRWLALSLAQENLPLQASHVVLTGSPGRLIPISAGCSVSVTSGGRNVRFACTES